VHAATDQWTNGAQGTDAPYRINWFMAPVRDLEIVERTAVKKALSLDELSA
jgi:hypothetical protein